MADTSSSLQPRIAFVKAATCIEFFSITEGTPAELLNSSNKPGPLALYTELNARFFIVNDSRALECRAWKETPYYGKKTVADLKKRYEHAKKLKVKGVTLDLDQVPWDSFDIVISFYIAIPMRIVKKHPEIMWCYYHWIPCPTYLLSKRYPLFKYNIFLNQWLSSGPLDGEIRNRIASRGKGQINFPATFLAGDTFSRIFPVQKRSGIQIEPRSFLLVTEKERETLSAFGPVSGRAPFPQFLQQLCSCKYFVVLQKKMALFRGNGFIEASSGGCLILVPEAVKAVHSDLVLGECRYDGWDGLLSLIRSLETDEKLYNELLKKQRAYHHKHVFQLPSEELLESFRIFKSEFLTRKKRNRFSSVKESCAFAVYIFNNFILNRIYRLFRGTLAFIIRPFTKKDPEDFVSSIIRKVFGNIF